MQGKTYQWHFIAAAEADIPWNERGIALVSAGEKKICIAKQDGIFYGFTPKCPHAGGLLTDAWLDKRGNLVCPLHGYRFNLRNGRNTSGEGFVLKIYPVEIREDGIYAGLETGGLLSWL